MKAYLSGEITGIPEGNRPAFHSAAEDLRKRGWEIVSPIEMDEADGVADDAPWGSLLARDVAIVLDESVRAVIVLPGWERSRGARLETYAGWLRGIPIFAYPFLRQVSRFELECAWLGLR